MVSEPFLLKNSSMASSSSITTNPLLGHVISEKLSRGAETGWPVWEIGLYSFEVAVSWSLPPSWYPFSLLEPCSALLRPPLDFFPHQALLRHWLKIHSPTLSSLDYPQLINRGLIGCTLLLLAIKCCCCFLGNQMVRFGIPTVQISCPEAHVLS
jgi:hypothetical protein